MKIDLPRELVVIIDERAAWNKLSRADYLRWIFTGKVK